MKIYFDEKADAVFIRLNENKTEALGVLLFKQIEHFFNIFLHFLLIGL